MRRRAAAGATGGWSSSTSEPTATEARQVPREGNTVVKGKLKCIMPHEARWVLGGAYKTVLEKTQEKKPEPKVHGDVYVLPKEFLIHLDEDRYEKLTVALVHM